MKDEASVQRQKPPRSKRQPATPFAVKPINAFYVFLAANLIAAAYAPIQDCDETFNFWEPAHYLSHGYGLQTWEYSPKYALRSWTYVSLHVAIGSLRRLLPFPSKVQEFYFIRYVLAFTCAVCQTRLFHVISNILNPRIALFFMMAMIFSPGMFHASASYLPSSFAMYTTMLGTAAFMKWTKEGLLTAQGIFWFAVGGILGWPFSLALSFPFLLEEVVFACLSSIDAIIVLAYRVLRGSGAALLVLLLEVLVSSRFYRKWTIVPLNIVLYNVFSGPGKGPEIFGTDPWHFYIRNLLLNFNIWFILAIVALPLFIAQKIYSRQLGEGGAVTGLRSVVFMSPFYLWLAIFSLQPHKEERFMYPVYPFLALNAAMALHIILATFGNSDPKSLVGRIPAKLKLLIVSIFVVGSIDVGLARIYGIYTAYSAPLKIYDVLQNKTHSRPFTYVCYGKDWYRLPSSYFLPNPMQVRFIKGEFRGLLPGQFATGESSQGFGPGTWLPTVDLNDENMESHENYVRSLYPRSNYTRAELFSHWQQIQPSRCDYLVDTYFPGSKASKLEPHYRWDWAWEKVVCVPFLDAKRTHVSSRLIWVPDMPFVPKRWRRKWGEHCLLRNVKMRREEEESERRRSKLYRDFNIEI